LAWAVSDKQYPTGVYIPALRFLAFLCYHHVCKYRALLWEIGGSSCAHAQRGQQMETAERTPSRERKRPYCILLIDDDQDIVEAFASGLTAEGHYVHATTHGTDLFRLAAQFEPDVLIADMIMDGVDTLDVMTTLRQTHPNMKIIAISGNPHLLTLALKHGADHALAKPFRLQKLHLLINIAMQ